VTTRALTGKVALVTGAGRGIGEAIAARLAADGAAVVMADIDQDACRAAAARLSEGGRASVRPVALDVRDRASCQDAVRTTVQAFGRLDILVNNAGVTLRLDAASTTEPDWQRILDVNLTGTFRMCQEALPHLAARADGAVVSLGSTAGQVAIPGSAAYSVSKAGILHLTRVLAVEWAAAGVRVNAVAPTIVPSDMTADVLGDAAYMAAKLATIPLGRIPERSDVADAVAWLVSPAASMITGHTIFVDGGATIS
jgi:NAD(P)-dependent dehydrogenase (short-subunit alcohol dehydrogenase family)